MTAGESLEEHFHDPRNVGEMKSPDATGRATNPVCGDEVALRLRFADETIVAARFVAFGCHAVIGVMSLLTERLQGREIAVARGITPDDLLTAFSVFPRGKRHAADVAVAALRDELSVRAS